MSKYEGEMMIYLIRIIARSLSDPKMVLVSLLFYIATVGMFTLLMRIYNSAIISSGGEGNSPANQVQSYNQ